MTDEIIIHKNVEHMTEVEMLQELLGTVRGLVDALDNLNPVAMLNGLLGNGAVSPGGMNAVLGSLTKTK